MLPGPFSIRRTRHHHPRSRPQGRISSVNSKVGTPIYPIVFASRRRRCRMYLSCSKSTDCNQSILYPCLPTILCSMFYNTICLQLCSFLKSQVSKITDPAHLEYIQIRRFAIARHVARLFVIYRRQWGIERMHPSGIQCVAVSCFALFEGLEHPENGDALITLCIAARDFGRHFVLARGVLWMIQFFCAAN